MKTPGLLLSTLVLAALAPGPSAALGGDGIDLSEALRRAVDEVDPAKRRAAADEVLARDDADLATLLEVMRNFDPVAVAKPGFHEVSVDLPTPQGPEATCINAYVPAACDGTKAVPLLLSHHGAGGHGRTEPPRWKDVADALGMVVVAFTDADPVPGYRFSVKERMLAEGTLRWARRTFRVDPNRVIATGFSRGGHLTWDVALRTPDRFAAIAPVVGGPRISNQQGENNIRFLENLVALPIRDLQGSGDDRLLLANLRLAFKRLESWGAADARLIEFPDRGHDADMAAVDWAAWFGEVRRDPAPERVVLRTLGAEGSRSFWVEALRVGRTVKDKVQPTVDAKKWARMSADEQRDFMLQAYEKATGRIEVRRTGVGTFDVKTRGVEKARLLLAEGMWDPQVPVAVRWNGRLHRRKVAVDRRVLVYEFVERFDPTFLPAASVEIP